MRALVLGGLLLAAAPAAAGRPSAVVGYTPPSRLFTCELQAEGWHAFESETPRGSSVHILGPAQAGGVWRAAYHIHFVEKGKPGFIPATEALRRERRKDKPSGRESTPVTAWRIARKGARVFEILETRSLPLGRLPASAVALHHFYALIPTGRDDYVIVKLSTTQETYLDYRAEFRRFLESFRMLGD